MLYGDGTSEGGYYDRETFYQYGLGECGDYGELGGLFSFIGKAAKGALSLVPGGSTIAALIPGGGGPSAPRFEGILRASDGARWSSKKRIWEFSGKPAPAGPPLSKAVVLLPTAEAIASGYKTEMGPGAARFGLAAVSPVRPVMAPAPKLPVLILPRTPAPRSPIPPILQPGRSPTGPNVPAIPATPSEAAGGVPAGYGGTPAFPMLPLLIGVGLIGALALARSSGGRNWQ